MNVNNPEVLIVGGGITGLTAALTLNRLGIAVALIEKSEDLGGPVRFFCCKATEACQQCGVCLLNDTVKSIKRANGIEVLLNSKLTDIKMDAKEFLYTYSRPGGGGQGRAKALLLTTGFTPFRAEDKPQYRTRKLPNVLTGLDLEKQLRENGKILKPTDQRPPTSIAFIQCVGSRDPRLGRPYCSQVCCGYTLRMANHSKHKNPNTEITIFYMDIQTFGKDFPLFMEKTKKQLHFIRSIPGDIQEGKGDQVILTFEPEEGRPTRKQAFDLVVLSIGIGPGPDHSFFIEKLGLTRNEDGFLTKGKRERDSLKGIFLAGTVQGPKSIAGSITQAYKAVEEIAEYLKQVDS